MLFSCIFYFHYIVLHKPCQPQISPYRHYTSTSVSFSWTGCSRDKVATALEYLVSCANHVQLRTSTTTRVTGLRPNKRYNSCSVSGIDNLGRLGERASFSFTTLKIGKLQYAVLEATVCSTVSC